VTLFDGVVSAFGIAFGLLGAWWLTVRFDLRKENFQGRRIPASAGLAFLLAAAFAYGVEWSLWRFQFGAAFGATCAYVVAAVGFGLLGFWDDVCGDRGASGFRGHLGRLAGGRLTTGAVKMFGGGLLSLIAAYAIWRPDWLHVVVSALVIALAANTLNLLDLRPGRCLAAFLVAAGALILMLVHERNGYVTFYLGYAEAVAFLLYLFDRQGRIMIGDTGSNAFGAVLGVGAALYVPVFAQTIVLAVLALFNLWCESHSLSKTIDENPVLSRIDRQIGVR
jgi:UDP-N-acetylmuramyl pentapeptide phosphotransferase/UDP-N-acetylglucosamine-1-phosphate transferase